MRSRQQKAVSLTPSNQNISIKKDTFSTNNSSDHEQKETKTIKSFSKVIINKFNSIRMIVHCFNLILVFLSLSLLCFRSTIVVTSSIRKYTPCNSNSSSSLSSSLNSNNPLSRIQPFPLNTITAATTTTMYDNLNVSIFYSIHIPSKEKMLSSSSIDVLSIIQEQIQIYKESTILNPNINAFLYYNIQSSTELVTNNANNANNEIYGTIVNILNEAGGKQLKEKPHQTPNDKPPLEMTTVSSLYNHCQSYPNNKVIYMHNNNIDISHRLLKMSTKSIFTNDCLFMEEENNNDKEENDGPSLCQCTICSARFSPLPNYHAPGNIWIAQCSYILQLIPPNNFQNAMDFVVQNAISSSSSLEGKDNIPTMNRQQKERFIQMKSNSIFLGTHEYALSHWPFSHPYVCPCDIYPGPYTWGNNNEDHLPHVNTNWKPFKRIAPRFPQIEDYMRYKRNIMSNNKKGKIVPIGEVFGQKWYYALSGRIFEWKLLYGMLPNKDSWIWRYYKNSKSFSS